MQRVHWGYKAAFCGAICVISAGTAAAAPLGPARILGTPRPSPLLLTVQSQAAELKASDVEGPPGQPLPLNIRMAKADGPEQLFILTGIPEGFTLNPGGYFNKFWAVNSKVMANLVLTPPEGYSGSFTVSVVRRREGAASTTAALFKVTIREPAAPATVTTEAVAPTRGPASLFDAPPAKPAKPLRKANPNEAAYMARGKQLLESGDISGARAVFENLALQGSATGAMALGETYDPVILRTMLVKGLEADAEKARKWYLRAEELGGPDARNRLNELANR